MSRSSRIGPVSGGGGGSTPPPPATSAWKQVGIIGVVGVFLLLVAKIFGTFGWENWLSFAVLLFMAYAMISVLTRPGAPYAASKKTFQMVFGGVVLILFVLSPLWGWQQGTVKVPVLTSSTTTMKPEQTTCEDGSDKEVRLCPIGKGGSEPLKSEDSVPSGIRLCYEPEEGVRAERWIEKVGGKPRSFFRFVSTNGEFIVVRYKFKESCQGPL